MVVWHASCKSRSAPRRSVEYRERGFAPLADSPKMVSLQTAASAVFATFLPCKQESDMFTYWHVFPPKLRRHAHPAGQSAVTPHLPPPPVQAPVVPKLELVPSKGGLEETEETEFVVDDIVELPGIRTDPGRLSLPTMRTAVMSMRTPMRTMMTSVCFMGSIVELRRVRSNKDDRSRLPLFFSTCFLLVQTCFFRIP
jgi:hypothetical protein